jgi:hypothetical protein
MTRPYNPPEIKEIKMAGENLATNAGYADTLNYYNAQNNQTYYNALGATSVTIQANGGQIYNYPNQTTTIPTQQVYYYAPIYWGSQPYVPSSENTQPYQQPNPFNNEPYVPYTYPAPPGFEWKLVPVKLIELTEPDEDIEEEKLPIRGIRFDPEVN